MWFYVSLVQPFASSLHSRECETSLDVTSTHLVQCSLGDHMIATHETIKYIMFIIAWESGYNVWQEIWYALQYDVLVRMDLFLTNEDSMIVDDVIIMDPT